MYNGTDFDSLLNVLGWLRAARRQTNPAARTVDRANGSNRK
ncbi:hypothetical protein [Microcoleus sp. LEGE 07076]|nr:hypothetical protein [Microcoleus sp. LEGE 07076]